jgi:hypothetical protein
MAIDPDPASRFSPGFPCSAVESILLQDSDYDHLGATMESKAKKLDGAFHDCHEWPNLGQN